MKVSIDKIEAAHSKVKSGADFPAYIQDIKSLGVHSYSVLVKDGTTIYKDTLGNELISSAKYNVLIIESNLKRDDFLKKLKKHQLGETSYMQFCQDCADTGVVSWLMDLQQMRCIYFDTQGIEIWSEVIPG